MEHHGVPPPENMKYQTRTPNLFLSRKGIIDNLLWSLVWLILLGIVIVSYYQFGARIQSDTRFDRILLARDTALLLDAARTPTPNYLLKVPMRDHRLRIESGTVNALATEELGAPGSKTPTTVSEKALFGVDPSLPIPSIEIPSRTPFILFKDDAALHITTKPSLSPGARSSEKERPLPLLRKLTCPPLAPGISSRLIIDPGHGGMIEHGDPGSIGTINNKNTAESELTTRIANEIASRLRATGTTPRLTRSDNTPLDGKTRRERITPGLTVLSIHTHLLDATTVPRITAYIRAGPNTAESTALACASINALLDDETFPLFSGGNILPLDIAHLAPGDDRRILDTGTNGVYLLITGMDLATAENPFIDGGGRLGSAIGAALTGGSS